jgi:propionyl-CoA synthetase
LVNRKHGARRSTAGSPTACDQCLLQRPGCARGQRPRRQAALIVDSPVTGSATRLQLCRAARGRGALRRRAGGARREHGDRVLIYMPMVPEAVIGMLACARIGAIHSVVFGGFASNELAVRIDDASRKVILSASCGIEPNRTVAYKPLLDAPSSWRAQARHCMCAARGRLKRTLIPGRDSSWARLWPTRRRRTACPCRRIIRSTFFTPRGPRVSPRAWSAIPVAVSWRSSGACRHIYGVAPGEVFWAASDVGWVVGHSYIVYGPCSTAIPRSFTRANPWARRMPARSGG